MLRAPQHSYIRKPQTPQTIQATPPPAHPSEPRLSTFGSALAAKPGSWKSEKGSSAFDLSRVLWGLIIRIIRLRYGSVLMGTQRGSQSVRVSVCVCGVAPNVALSSKTTES